MHRKKTKLVGRTERLTRRIGGGAPLVRTAKKIEFRGIITTYKVHDRLLGNKRARSHFDDAPPELDDVQRRVLDDLERDDYVVVPFADLVSQETLGTIQADGDAWARQAASDDSRDATKDYLIRRYAQGDEVAPASPWLSACLSSRLLDLANTYLQMSAKLEYVDFWYSVPVETTSDRMLSQRWHRDFDDKHLLKAFLYLVDVDEEMGPFQYVAGSQPGGPYADAWPWKPLGDNYPSEGDLERRVPESAVRRFVGPQATLVFCNTAGFHRGGFSTTAPRVLATATYSSPASLASLTERSYDFAGSLDELDAVTRFALA
jgi:hypothetical protein